MSRPTATGLRKKDTYEQMTDYLDHGQEKIKYPNRHFRQLRDSPWLSQLDGDDLNDMESQQLKESKIIQQQTIIREVAQASGISAQEARINHNTTNNYNTTNNTTNNHHNPSGGPDVNMSTTTTTDAGVQSERPGNTVMGTQTDHPLKQSTGTGTDYTPPPDNHTHKPPPSNFKISLL